MKKQIKTLAFCLIIALKMSFVNAQKIEGHFVIAKFLVGNYTKTHPNKAYYWIINQDSITVEKMEFLHLYIENFTKDNLEDCCNRVAFDAFIISKRSNFDIDKEYLTELSNLKKQLDKNKKKMIIYKKRWINGNKEKIIVSIIPIKGIFCFSDFHEIGQKRLGYQKEVSVPFSSFEFDKDFWKSEKYKMINNYDFIQIPYNLNF
jgi:hypothetical protein